MPRTLMADTSRRGSCCCCCTVDACSRRREESMLCLELSQPRLACSALSTCLDPSSNTCWRRQAQLHSIKARADIELPVNAFMLSYHCFAAHCNIQEASAEHPNLKRNLQGMRQTEAALCTWATSWSVSLVTTVPWGSSFSASICRVSGPARS